MVKLVDTLVSGTSGLTAVQVRVLFWALIVELTTCKTIVFEWFFVLHTKTHAVFGEKSKIPSIAAGNTLHAAGNLWKVAGNAWKVTGNAWQVAGFVLKVTGNA